MILKSKYFKKLYYYSLTIHCVHLSAYSEIDLSQLLYSFWRVGIIMSKLKKISYALIKYYSLTHYIEIKRIFFISYIFNIIRAYIVLKKYTN